MKEWIKKNLILNNRLCPKRLNKEWFVSSHNIDVYEKILQLTSFLLKNSKFSQRVWHVYNDKLENIYCKTCFTNITTYIDFKRGYIPYCSSKCAQSNPETKLKIQQVNLEKYGVSHPLMSKKIQEKAKVTMIEKYGVDNISKSKTIKEIKKQTCLKNHGVDTVLRNRKQMEELNKI